MYRNVLELIMQSENTDNHKYLAQLMQTQNIWFEFKSCIDKLLEQNVIGIFISYEFIY